MPIPLPPHTLAETPSLRMFWVSFAPPPYPVTIHAAAYKFLTVPAGTDRIIRVPSLLDRASDHRHSQVESEFRTDRRSRVDLQRDKRHRVHVRVSVERNETSLPCLVINLQQGQGRKGEVDQRYGVEHGIQRYWRSAICGSGQEQRRKGIRASIVIIFCFPPAVHCDAFCL